MSIQALFFFHANGRDFCGLCKKNELINNQLLLKSCLQTFCPLFYFISCKTKYRNKTPLSDVIIIVGHDYLNI